MTRFRSFISNNFEVKLTSNQEELHEVMHLRYKELLLSFNNTNTNENEVFEDQYDKYCDHLIAVDLTTNKIVGTYRLVRNEHIKEIGYFVTEYEYDISKIKEFELLEIGRAVVKEGYRNGAVLMLLFKGLIRYAVSHNIKYMFGTGSFLGIDPNPYNHALSYIYHNHLSPIEIRAKAVDDFKCNLNIIPQDELDESMIKKQMPPLIKGYLKIGATFGEDGYMDIPFNSLDVFVIFDVINVNPKFLQRFLEN